ncbi:hypothetical protein K469DRAFT_746704 [Zopfia rhizophila CBS 207.26]|uniref:Heterokaryon incompatibility domain-containing protein n=1 Tax=Zopfia rhizophila CBS 207.26 TaxID=1314779 RepID=A0A6A6EI45_9PEZI|nr:hypothetical protein K469DRAFT_746704 [Zopfia rhizophila CBS 207.26]
MRGLSDWNTTIDVDLFRDQEQIRWWWYNIMEAYTTSGLSFPSDRLIAISGITKRFQSLLENTSIVGLWQKTFVLAFLWCRAWVEQEGFHRTGMIRLRPGHGHASILVSTFR